MQVLCKLFGFFKNVFCLFFRFYEFICKNRRNFICIRRSDEKNNTFYLNVRLLGIVLKQNTCAGHANFYFIL